MIDKKFEKAMEPILLSAIKYARSRLPLKSTNKVYTDKNLVSQYPKRQRLHSAEADKIRSKSLKSLRDLRLSPRQVADMLERDYLNRIPHAGNCGENSILAYYYLLDRASRLDSATGTQVQVLRVYMPAPVDHAFVLIGTRPSGNAHLLLENTMICDPWTKIVCPLDDFDRLWRLKMKKWSGRGLVGVTNEGYYDHYRDNCSLNTVTEGKIRINQLRRDISHSSGLYPLLGGAFFR
jgi:hypothetical protein